MAEQEVYGSKFSGHSPSIPRGAFTGSGAEQDRYASKFEGHAPSFPRGSFKGSGAEQDVYGSKFEGHSASLPRGSFVGSGAEQDVFGSHFNRTPYQGLRTSTIGLLHNAVLPSFTLHAGLSAVAYGISRYTNRVEGKDYLWASGMTLNAWWSAIGSRVVNDGLSVSQAWSSLGYSQKLLLLGVTAWGVRLTSRVVSRSLQRGEDDPRYAAKKTDPDFWNKALFTTFLPEAVAQTIIALPFTIPFRQVYECAQASPVVSYSSYIRDFAVFLFSAGFTLETLADIQLESFKKRDGQGVNREGVWSIVRHPNYLGDALIHASFPLFLLGSGLLHPITALGPIANYIFLRYIGGDKENEESQAERYSKHDVVKAEEFNEYRHQKNSFWPKLEEFRNSWTLGVLTAGVAGVLLERGLRNVL
jgi:steroid 5-alpha reductase family enzyme